jgi:hypothetical protein
MNTMNLLHTAVLGGLVATGAAFAQAPAERAPMSFAQIVDHVATLGYRDVREVERKGDKLFEVKARDTQDRWVELTIDARSGELLRSKLDR